MSGRPGMRKEGEREFRWAKEKEWQKKRERKESGGIPYQVMLGLKKKS